MADPMTSEIKNRMADLRAELDDLSLQLACAQRSETFVMHTAEVPVSALETGLSNQADHQGSLRTLRDLMWQGRWGLAFHLARAIELQGKAGVDFPASRIRAWALASRADRRHDDETLGMIEALLNEASGQSLAPKLLEWATLIGLLRGVDPAEVRAIAARFQVPDELPATVKWWQEYVEALASAERPTTRWTPLPEPQAAAAEIDELVLRSEAEPVRLASSCLLMSIRCAMRHVRVLATADERFVLNSELERTSLAIMENGEVTSPASEVEQAVCELAATLPRGRQVMISADSSAKDLAFNASATAESVDFTSTVAAMAPTVVQATLSMVAAGAESMNSDSPLPSTNTAAVPAGNRLTARERLERYAQRLAIQESNKKLVVKRAEAVTAQDAVSESITTPSQTQAVASEPTVLPFPGESHRERTLESTASRAPAESIPMRPTADVANVRTDERRGIHETAVATAFGVEGAWDPQRSATPARPTDGISLSTLFFNPQSAIVAGLLIIAGAVVAGLGTGLMAKGAAQSPTQVSQESGGEESPDVAGDFPMMD